MPVCLLRVCVVAFLFSSPFYCFAQEPSPKDSMVPPFGIEIKIDQDSIENEKKYREDSLKQHKKLEKTPQRTNVDSLFKRARSLAYNGNRKDARIICRKILEIKPDYHDVRVFMARTYSWGKLYGKARPQLYLVLASKPNHLDALNALLDIELWSYDPEAALEIADRGLAVDPQNQDFLYKKAKAYEMLGEYEKAKALLKELLAINPESADGKRMMKNVQNMLIKNAVAITYNYDYFKAFYTPRHLYTAEYKRNQKNYTVLGRVNYAERFEKTGTQFEGDLYTRISSGLTGYVNVGYSKDSIFPRLRYGVEIFNKLPRGFESSIGYRYIGFHSNKLIIYTGSLNKYIYKYWISFRPYITPDNSGVARSYTVQVRRYFRTSNDYVTLRGGFGVSPDFINYGTLYEQLYNLKTRNLGILYHKEIKNQLIGLAGAALHSQELAFRPGNFVMSYNFEVGLKYRF